MPLDVERARESNGRELNSSPNRKKESAGHPLMAPRRLGGDEKLPPSTEFIFVGGLFHLDQCPL